MTEHIDSSTLRWPDLYPPTQPNPYDRWPWITISPTPPANPNPEAEARAAAIAALVALLTDASPQIRLAAAHELLTECA